MTSERFREVSELSGAGALRWGGAVRRSHTDAKNRNLYITQVYIRWVISAMSYFLAPTQVGALELPQSVID